MAKQNKIKKIIFDGDLFYFKHNGEIVQANYDEIKKIKLKNPELILTENLYSFEKIEDNMIETLKSEEILKYFIWKLKIKTDKQFFTIKKTKEGYFGFIIGEKESEMIKRIFQNKIGSLRPFIFTLYDKLIKDAEPFSLLIVNYKNLTDFLIIGERSPVLLRKKYNLIPEEITQEIIITNNFIKNSYNIVINNIYSNMELEIENMKRIEQEPFKVIL